MDKMINKWLEAGVINKETALVMLNDIKEEKSRRNRIKLNILIYTVAALLIGLGVISFISANDWLLKLFNMIPCMKIIASACLTVAALFFGYKLAYENNKFPRLGHSLIFLSTLLIGGTYALIGQTYNINAHNSGLMFLWLISILPVAYIFKNFAINVVTVILFVLGIIFYYMDLGLDMRLTWTIFIPVLIGCSLYTIGNIPYLIEKYNNFSLSYKLTGLSTIFVTLMILTCSVEHSYEQRSAFYIVPLVVLILANLINFIMSDKQDKLFKTEVCYIISILAILLLIITLSEVSTGYIMFLANILIIIMIAAGYNYGYKFEHSGIIGLSNWFLIIYLTTNYCRWGWDYMDKALFFILGGVGLLALGMFLEKKRKEITKKEN